MKFTHILAFIRYFFIFMSINSHTSSSKLAVINLKQPTFVWVEDVPVDDVSCDGFFKKSFSNNLISSFRLFKADVADIFSLGFYLSVHGKTTIIWLNCEFLLYVSFVLILNTIKYKIFFISLFLFDFWNFIYFFKSTKK